MTAKIDRSPNVLRYIAMLGVPVRVNHVRGKFGWKVASACVANLTSLGYLARLDDGTFAITESGAEHLLAEADS